nr:unnamed protein product [Callosobruchus analis]
MKIRRIPECAIDTTLQSISPATIKQYGVTYKLWFDYCNRFKVSPFHAKVPEVLTFLQSILENSSCGYGSINSHRAALSLILSEHLGNDVLLKRFMKGVLRLRPPKPRYNCVWDPKEVLDYFITHPAESLRSLSIKLVTLLLLATGQRLQTISLIKLSNIQPYDDGGVQILIEDRIKTSNVNTNQPCLFIPKFNEQPELCVVSCLHKYIQETKTLRSTNDVYIFITFQKPYRSASKQTLSRWVKCALDQAGVNTNIFKPHSSRHASTSAANRAGVAIDLIKDSAAFARFYNRPLINHDDFALTVLRS